jgi:hypothetical protein
MGFRQLPAEAEVYVTCWEYEAVLEAMRALSAIRPRYRSSRAKADICGGEGGGNPKMIGILLASKTDSVRTFPPAPIIEKIPAIGDV